MYGVLRMECPEGVCFQARLITNYYGWCLLLLSLFSGDFCLRDSLFYLHWVRHNISQDK